MSQAVYVGLSSCPPAHSTCPPRTPCVPCLAGAPLAFLDLIFVYRLPRVPTITVFGAFI